tara:strand:+ start:12960 stop:14783 length:1824 start_codon:yes stop_codon:yes gene_type:complete
MFFGAFNDNVFKNALVILITFKAYGLGSLSPEMMVSLCGGIFILPFFLFSSTAGQICDKYPKNQLMLYIKLWEIGVMLLGAYGFITEQIGLLIITLFLMGLQSTFFGPVKYSILPELLPEEKLVEGNAFFSMGTFVSILLGTILGGSLIAIEGVGETYVAIAVMSFAVIGSLFSLFILKLPAGEPELRINKNPFSSMIEILKITKEGRGVFLAILALSWFWFLGAALLSMFPVYVKDYIGGNEYVATFFLALFSIGVAVGSIICMKLSRRGLELGLVPFGTFGMSLFIFDLYLIGGFPHGSETYFGVWEFITRTENTRIMIDIFCLSAFAGFFTVPLMTYVQQFSPKTKRSRIISGLNIINALFMVISAVTLVALYALKLTVPQIFGVWSVCNLLVGLYIYSVIPEFFLRFLAKFVLKFIYRIKVKGREHIPKDQACILTCNHVSFIDWLVIYGCIDRPVRFIMSHKYHSLPIIGFLFKDAGVIPIATRSENEELLEKAYLEIQKALNNNELICIFPEGGITLDGELAPFRKGIEKILTKNPVPVIPMTLQGLWGSFFSRIHNKKALNRPSLIIKRWFSKVELTLHEPWQPQEVSAEKLEAFTRDKL